MENREDAPRGQRFLKELENAKREDEGAEPKGLPFTPVLIDTVRPERANMLAEVRDRIRVRDPATSSNRSFLNGIPKRIEALYILIADNPNASGAILTREELDMNPRTKDLSSRDKDALAKHWPKFQESQKKAYEIRKLRDDETRLALRTHKKGTELRERLNLDELPIADQLLQTARVFNNQIYLASLSLAATNVEDIHSDPLSLALYKNRVTYVRDFVWVARNLVDLAERIRATDDSSVADGMMSAETQEMLSQADALLLAQGMGRTIKVRKAG